MKVQCPKCKVAYEIDESKVSHADSLVRCPKCQHPLSLKSEKAEQVDTTSCPNCGHIQPPSPSCIKCGIVFSKYKAKEPRRPDKKYLAKQSTFRAIRSSPYAKFLYIAVRIIASLILVILGLAPMLIRINRHITSMHKLVDDPYIDAHPLLLGLALIFLGLLLIQGSFKPITAGTSAKEHERTPRVGWKLPLGVVLILGLGFYSWNIYVWEKRQEAGIQSVLHTSLRIAATAQEAYYTEHRRYADSVEKLIGKRYDFTPVENVTVAVTGASTAGYTMLSWHSSGDKTFSIAGPGGSITEIRRKK